MLRDRRRGQRARAFAEANPVEAGRSGFWHDTTTIAACPRSRAAHGVADIASIDLARHGYRSTAYRARRHCAGTAALVSLMSDIAQVCEVPMSRSSDVAALPPSRRLHRAAMLRRVERAAARFAAHALVRGHSMRSERRPACDGQCAYLQMLPASTTGRGENLGETAPDCPIRGWDRTKSRGNLPRRQRCGVGRQLRIPFALTAWAVRFVNANCRGAP